MAIEKIKILGTVLELPGTTANFDLKPLLTINREEFPCLVHKLSVTLTTLQYKPQ